MAGGAASDMLDRAVPLRDPWGDLGVWGDIAAFAGDRPRSLVIDSGLGLGLGLAIHMWQGHKAGMALTTSLQVNNVIRYQGRVFLEKGPLRLPILYRNFPRR